MDYEEDEREQQGGGLAGSREVLTLQIGRYSNFVGAHYWNFQDELWGWAHAEDRSGKMPDAYDPSIMFSYAQKTLAPRLLAWDTRDGLGGMHPGGTLAARGSAASSSGCLWAGNVAAHSQEPEHTPNAFQRFLAADEVLGSATGQYTEPTGVRSALSFQGTSVSAAIADGQLHGEDSAAVEEEIVVGAKMRKHPFGLDDAVVTWTDYLKTHVARGSVQLLPFRDGDSCFDTYASGDSSASSPGSALHERDREAYSDALRRQLEECDAVQGVQCLVDFQGGWAALAADMLTETRDECRSCPLLCFPLLLAATARTETTAGGASRTDPATAVNSALALHALSETASLLTLLSEAAAAQAGAGSPHVALHSSSAYHTAAVLAAALDTATSPYRFCSKAAPFSVSQWAAGAAGAVNRSSSSRASIASLVCAVPWAERDMNAEQLRAAAVASETALSYAEFVKQGLPARLSW
jgi:Misato Segment II tubulin-like domain/Tubulin domain